MLRSDQNQIQMMTRANLKAMSARAELSRQDDLLAREFSQNRRPAGGVKLDASRHFVLLLPCRVRPRGSFAVFKMQDDFQRCRKANRPAARMDCWPVSSRANNPRRPVIIIAATAISNTNGFAAPGWVAAGDRKIFPR